MENRMAIPQVSEHRITTWASNCTSMYKPKKVKAGTRKDTSTTMFVAAL
jgi:hypothetical protein